MIDLKKFSLPDSVIVKGRVFDIHTDFQFFITFSLMLKEKHELKDYDFMYNGKIPEDRNEGFLALVNFAFPKQELPRQSGEENSVIYLDYEKDGDLIYSAFYQCYKIDLMKENLHWHSFLALLHGVRDTQLNEVMRFRGYKPGKNDSAEYRQQMNRLKNMWKIEEEEIFTEEEQKILDEFNASLKTN